MQHGRKTSRFQEIDVNYFRAKPVSSERTVRPVNDTSAIQARSSEDRGFQRWTGTWHVGDKTLRERTERPVIDHDDFSHEKIMVNEADMDFRIPGLPHSVVKQAQSTSVRDLIQKIENPSRSTRSTTRSTTKNKHMTLSVQNQRKWFRMWATSNCVNCSKRNPKRSAQGVYHTERSVYSITRAGISCKKKERPINKSSIKRWTFFQSQSMSSRREDLTDTNVGNNQETKKHFRLTNWRRNAKRRISENSWPIPTRPWTPCSNDWKSSKWKSLSTMGCSYGWRSHSPIDRTRIFPLKEQMVASFQ